MVALHENSLRVLESRYLLRDREGKIVESPEALFRRVAGEMAGVEIKWGLEKDVKYWQEKFYEVMSKLLFLPNSPTLMNAGTSANQLSACFVLPVEDNMDGIFTTLKNTALIQQSGGGTGFNFSHLRPKGDFVSAGSGRASGPVSFMKIFDSATEHVKQGGKRRGANMGILNVSHPDIEEFIASKRGDQALANFNISVGITDDFMQAVELNEQWKLVHPSTREPLKIISARRLWNEIVESAWLTGDPGMIFMDTVNAQNPTPALGPIESTNPCGEVPLLSYEPCNLGSINLSRFVSHSDGKASVDWHHLEEVVNISLRFLDNVVEANTYIIPEIKSMALGNRKIGLGVMGWAELLIQLEIPYDTDQAVRLGRQMMQFIQEKARAVSVELAKTRGSFPNWPKSIYSPHTPVRNATRTSIAPTGTISIIAETSSSIEPLFALAFHRRHVLNEETLVSVNEHFLQYLKLHHLYSDKLVEQVMNEGIAQNLDELPRNVRELFKTALEISPYWHLQHQLAFQEFTENAVSKTINLPEDATVADVEEIYKSAWKLKAKGITIFRYNSKGRQVLHQGIQSEVKACKVCLE